jgi:serine/threonine-protein kinase RsbW
MTTTAITPDMELALPARAENVAVVRHAFGALGEAFAVDEQILSDIRLAVTEACTNVVVHAYPDGHDGPLEVLAALLDDELNVVVRDHGPGIVPRPDSPGLGLGLPLIASLAESVQLGRDEQERTEVRMTFSLLDTPHRYGFSQDGARGSSDESNHAAAPSRDPHSQPSGTRRPHDADSPPARDFPRDPGSAA